MPKNIQLMGDIQIQPLEMPNPDKQGEIMEGKQIVLLDRQAGETIIYPMTQELASRIGHQLKKSNKGLMLELEEEQRRAQAQAMLSVDNGQPTTEQKKVAEDILRGVHQKEQ